MEAHQLINELADTGADPFWVAEAIAAEQHAAKATAAAEPPRQRPPLRLVASDEPQAKELNIKLFSGDALQGSGEKSGDIHGRGCKACR